MKIQRTSELAQIFCFINTKEKSNLRLAIGAPSSPRLSNILMLEFDTKISGMVAKEKVTYTRYADD